MINFIAFFSAIAFSTLTIICNNQNTILNNKSNFCKTVRVIFPQGWAFFTKDPIETQIELFRFNDNLRKFTPYLENNFST